MFYIGLYVFPEIFMHFKEFVLENVRRKKISRGKAVNGRFARPLKRKGKIIFGIGALL